MAQEGAKKSFRYVYIPADVDEPIQELSLDIPEGQDVECLLDHLKKHFSGPGITEAQRAARRKALIEQLGDKDISADKLNPRMLDMAADMQMVENISLLANSRDVGHVGVNMYCDDHAQAKQLPFNARATGLAECCGKLIQVRGDVFLARIFDDDNKFERLDFTLSEVSSSAAWVREAKQQAQRRDAAHEDAKDIMNRLQTTRAAAKQAPLPPPPLTDAERAKERGNDAVKRGDWAAALEEYSTAVTQQPDLLAATSNRALAYLKLGRLEDAIRDCDTVLATDPSNVKARLRRAAAHETAGRAQQAADDYRQVLQLQPHNKEAAAALDKLQPPPVPQPATEPEAEARV